MSETICACVIARDEEERLPDCLSSLSFCDEVVLVDSGSRDRTREIAIAAGARTIENPWPGFAAQRNVAIDNADCDWVLEIDADERVTPELAIEIRAFLADPPAAVRMAALPMRDIFLGRALGPSNRYPRYRHRLFRRGAFRHDEARSVHEGLWPDGPTHPFEGDLQHLLASSWGEALGDANVYARLEGRHHSRPGAAEALTGIVLRPAVKFAYRAALYGGWRDGGRGLAKIGLECAADSLATVYRFRHSVAGTDGGFGQEAPRLGPVRIVGVALRPAGARELAPWLRGAGAAGADVALIGGDEGDGVPSRRLPRRGQGALVRALDAENQLRPVDALVPAGGRERRRLRLVPAPLRGVAPAIDPETPPGAAVAALRAQTRAAAAT